MKNQLEQLFSKEMTRKEFLQHIGAAAMVVFGISGLVNALQPKAQNSRVSGMGYGASAYGGAKK